MLRCIFSSSVFDLHQQISIHRNSKDVKNKYNIIYIKSYQREDVFVVLRKQGGCICAQWAGLVRMQRTNQTQQGAVRVMRASGQTVGRPSRCLFYSPLVVDFVPFFDCSKTRRSFNRFFIRNRRLWRSRDRRYLIHRSSNRKDRYGNLVYLNCSLLTHFKYSTLMED